MPAGAGISMEDFKATEEDILNKEVGKSEIFFRLSTTISQVTKERYL